MALPKAVQEQVDAADALVAQLNGQTGQNPETTPNDPPPNDPPAPNLEQQQTVSQEPEQKPAVSEEVWERKYLTLKGMYDAEVPRLHAQMREMNGQLQQLIAENAVAKTQQQAPAQANVKSLITEQDKEAFGPDLLDLIDRATEAKVSDFRNREAQLTAKIDELQGKLGNVSERQVVSDKDRLFSGLAQQVPDWEAMNVDQGFLSWLAEVDPVYGLPRQYALNNAFETLDVNRTANIFKQYKATLAPAQQTQQNRQQQLQRQVAPTRSKNSPPPATSDSKPVWDQNQITQFYEDWRRGMLDDTQAAQMEKDIHAAIAEGRIR